MKKLLIGLFAASLLAASAIGYAGSITFVNNYNKPVTFVVSAGAVYNPIVAGTVPAGGRSTLEISGPFTSDMNFLAWTPYGSSVVTNCGKPYGPVDNVTVRAGWPYGGNGPNYGYDRYDNGRNTGVVGGVVGGAVGGVFGLVGLGSTGPLNCVATTQRPAEVSYERTYKKQKPCHLKHHHKVVYSEARG